MKAQIHKQGFNKANFQCEYLVFLALTSLSKILGVGVVVAGRLVCLLAVIRDCVSIVGIPLCAFLIFLSV